ncbi:MAG: DNA polymerase III subunit delta [Alphaproteobacteria bacterium]|nr:DNA polymerase III subunit delta [Alphaproteobacteria bacterium]MBM3629897.1 DNA polymerase III subunit delta [Alphaproteobacteria bacterium]
MKIDFKGVERFLKAPDKAARAILVFGPDEGLVRERAAALARSVVEDLADPFRVAEFSGDVLASDPAKLADEAAALAFGGGRRVVRVRGCGNAAAPAFKSFLDAPVGDALVVAEAGELDTRSALRKLFEGAPNAAALACYGDEGRDLVAVIRAALQAEGVRAADDAVAWLAQRLGGDRAATRSEIAKLATYAGPGAEVSLADARAVVGETAELDADDAVQAAALGDVAALGRALDRLDAEGASAVAILRTAQRFFVRLHVCACHVSAGADASGAMARLRPPVFWKEQDVYKRALRRLDERALARALSLLLAAERAAKSGLGRAGTLAAQRALYAIAGAQASRGGLSAWT